MAWRSMEMVALKVGAAGVVGREEAMVEGSVAAVMEAAAME